MDGYYARKLGQTSRLGAFLDPVADKLIVAAALVLIVSKDPRWFVVIVAVVIIGREIAVSALREWMAEIGARGRIKVSVLAKYKTIMQIVGLSLLLFRQDIFGHPDLQAWAGADRRWRRFSRSGRWSSICAWHGRNCGAVQGFSRGKWAFKA